ncbi:MAG: hypothetical protein MIO90_08125 [Methanomassiliicoccales archaeon]|nr:hypothetical protein [Methanomassiliicoccales archaeon]
MKRVLVIGLGAAGLYASKLLAENGWEVTAVGRGTPMTALSTGCLRGESLKGRSLEGLTTLFREKGMPMVSGDRIGITNLGTSYECSLSPPRSTWAKGDGPRTITVMGMGDHPALRPALAASVLSTWGPEVKAQTFPLRVPSESQLSVAFRDPGRSDMLVKMMKEAWGEAVLLPPLFSLNDYHKYDDLERRSGRKVLEAIAPLGTPGRRFLEVLWAGALDAGAQLWPGRKVSALGAERNTVTMATVQGGLETRAVELEAVLVATGGPLGDGLQLRSSSLVDPFSLFRIVADGDAFRGGYANDHGRLLSLSGSPMSNAFGAGDCLSSPQRKYGQGLSEALGSAWKAVQAMEGL